jgi:CDP-paratose 2-epimerase
VRDPVLVTGGAGFAGSHLAIALKRRYPEARVIAFDSLRRRGSELNLDRLTDAGVRFVHGDIRNPEDLAALDPPGLILECSAEASVLAGYGESPEFLIRTNLMGCYHCLELARRSRSDVMILSTSRVYPIARLNALAWREEEDRYSLLAAQTEPGASGRGIAEEFPLGGVRSLYGMTKLASEMMIEEYGAAYGMEFVINRCGLLTGPWQMARSDQGVIALWMAAHYFRKPLRYIGFGGSGKQVRDLLHVEDLCALVADQIEHWDRYRGRVWNVGGGLPCSLSLREATRLCEEISGQTIGIAPSSEERPADIRIYLSDTARVEAVNGWRPRHDARSTLESIHDWLKAEERRLLPVLGRA